MNKRKIVALYEIISAIVSLVFFFLYFSPFVLQVISGWGTDNSSRITVLSFAVVFLIFFILLIIAGVFLFRGKKIGYTLSTILLALQIPFITWGGFEYHMLLGLNFWIYVAEPFQFGFRFWLGPDFTLASGSEMNPLYLGISIVPILLIIFLHRAKKKEAMSY